jgi:hypothetical protein
MLSHCANSQCSKPFLRLKDGKLFLVEIERLNKRGETAGPRPRLQSQNVERFWLCNECAAKWTLAFDRERGVMLVPLRRPAASAPQSAASACSGVA